MSLAEYHPSLYLRVLVLRDALRRDALMAAARARLLPAPYVNAAMTAWVYPEWSVR